MIQLLREDNYFLIRNISSSSCDLTSTKAEGNESAVLVSFYPGLLLGVYLRLVSPLQGIIITGSTKNISENNLPKCSSGNCEFYPSTRSNGFSKLIHYTLGLL